MNTTVTPSLPDTGVWEIDPVPSAVSFTLTHHAIATFRSTFPHVIGAYDAATGTLSGEVQVANILLGSLPPMQILKEHLMKPDFFDAENFPTLAFRSTALQDETDEFIASGDLTMRGVTRAITARGVVAGPQTITLPTGDSDRIGIKLSTTIDRREWGIDYNNTFADGVLNLGWDVAITATLELARSAS